VDERWLSFTSDLGLDDASVGCCHGVIARAAPSVRVIDVCHAVAPSDVAHGAQVLAGAVGHLPVGVHLVVVDPPAAEPPRAVAVATADGSITVSPDNGVAAAAWEILGGVTAAHVLDDAATALRVRQPHPLTRGRDLLAPVAARLAAGLPLAQVGGAVDPATLVRLARRRARVGASAVRGHIEAVDHAGNLRLTATRDDLEAAGILLGDTVEVRMDARTLLVPFTTTSGEVPRGRVAVFEDADRVIVLGVCLGRASEVVRGRRGDPVVIAQAPRRAPAAVPAARIGLLDPPAAGSSAPTAPASHM
jgi:S-adenosylmethionine hydrolase